MIKITIIIIILFIILKKIKNYQNEKFNNIEYSNKLSDKDIIILKKSQKIMTNMFKVFHNICIKNNLRYWCIGGTLIGVMRHKGWIPWDGDIDVSIIQEDFDKLIDICKTELPKNMFLQDYKTDKYFINDYDKFKRRAKIRDINSNYLKAEKKYHNGLQLDLMKVKIIKKKIIKNIYKVIWVMVWEIH